MKRNLQRGASVIKYSSFDIVLFSFYRDLFYIFKTQNANANGKSTSKTIRKLGTLEEQGFMPVYERQEITDDFHETCGFKTDYQFITKRKMKGIQKKSKRR